MEIHTLQEKPQKNKKKKLIDKAFPPQLRTGMPTLVG
jgi:hypothetical protein